MNMEANRSYIKQFDSKGYCIIKNITVSIGSTPIDSLNGEWLNIYDELFSKK